MATVHPSRLNLIPENLRNEQDLPPDTARRHLTEYDRDRNGYSYSERRRSRSRERDRSGDRYNRRDEDRGRDNRRDDYDSRRRTSPKYDDYRRPEPASGSAPDRAGSMYPNKGSRSGYGQNADWLESRRLQRENNQVDIWPPSPPARYKELHSKHKSIRKSKRARSTSADSSSSEEERRRKERKERKRAKRARDRESERSKRDRKHRHRSRSRHRSYSSDEESESDSHRKRRHKSRSSKRSMSPGRRSPNRKSHSQSERRSKSKSLRPESRSPSRSPTPSNSDEGEWIVKESSVAPPVPLPGTANASAMKATSPPTSKKKGSSRATSQAVDDESDSDEEVGPKPLFKATTNKKIDERAYGGALLRGEGSAMAAFLQDGTDVRIPRRGEIGLTSDQIEQFENVGYVMSGSRHKRMNAVRMRKENQVISAEEKRGILKLQKEERERREAILREEFSELVNEKLKANPTHVAGPSKE